ncbi:MAG: hypothetical protein CMB64_02700 [Euryarchaeota archaeon]|nr:hypothetical protein [Euryarchaeota archaeon]|tara:strand:- start:1011 stop:1919 length:909 start_codon:yes stop_codon:yes gene_type:complete
MRVLIFDLLAERSEFGHGGNIEMIKPLTKNYSELEVFLITPQYEDFNNSSKKNLELELGSRKNLPYWDESIQFKSSFTESVGAALVNFHRIKTPVGSINELSEWIEKNEISCVFCSGSRRNVSEPEFWMTPSKNLILASIMSKKPFLGICFGHQLLSDTLGCHVVRSSNRTDAIYNLELTELGKKDPLFKNLLNEGLGPVTLFTHQDHVIKINNEFETRLELLGTSPHCENAAVRARDNDGFLPVWGVQFHPEASKSRIQRSYELGHISLEEKESFNREHDGAKILENFSLEVFRMNNLSLK